MLLFRKLCPHPFTSLIIGEQYRFAPCCHCSSNWLDNNFSQEMDIWNGQLLQKFRAHLYKKESHYCSQCKSRRFAVWKLIIFQFLKPIISTKYPSILVKPKNLLAIMRKQTYMPSPPANITLADDSSCNLACPSCRPDHIFKPCIASLEQRSQMIQPLIKTASNVTISGGEPLFGEWSLTFLRTLQKKNITLITNALLLTPSLWDSLGWPAGNSIKIYISIDAATAQTYHKVRGGSWETLLRNIAFISDLRRKRIILNLRFQFVVRKANYKEISSFVDFGDKFAADNIIFQEFKDWNHAEINFQDQAVHHTNHPEWYSLKKELQQIADRQNVIIEKNLKEAVLKR